MGDGADLTLIHRLRAPCENACGRPTHNEATGETPSMEAIMSKPLINIDDVEFVHELRHGDRFDARIAPIASLIGAQKLS